MQRISHRTGSKIIWIIALHVSASIGFANVLVADQPDIQTFIRLQQKIERVITDSMAACVSIGDGTGFGSGAVISPDGLIMTAGHVVSGGVSNFEVFFPDGRRTRAKLVGYDADIDAGLIKITDPGPWPFVRPAKTANAKLGDWLICLGHSGGYELGRKPPVRTGRVLEIREHLLVSDAALIGGDSGGPLFNLDGELIAIHSSIGDSIAENRHVLIDHFYQRWQKLVAGQRIASPVQINLADTPLSAPNSPPAQLAAHRQNINDQSVETNKLGIKGTNRGNQVAVSAITPGSAAERVGLRVGDVVLSFDGQSIRSADHLTQLIESKNVGQSVTIDISRNGRKLRLQVILDRLR